MVRANLRVLLSPPINMSLAHVRVVCVNKRPAHAHVCYDHQVCSYFDNNKFYAKSTPTDGGVIATTCRRHSKPVHIQYKPIVTQSLNVPPSLPITHTNTQPQHGHTRTRTRTHAHTPADWGGEEPASHANCDGRDGKNYCAAESAFAKTYV